MAISRVVSEIFYVEKCRDLEMGSKVTQGHVVSFERLCMVSYCSLVALSLKCTVFEIFDL